MIEIEQVIESRKEDFIQIAKDIWEYAEIGYDLPKSSSRMIDYLKECGFRVKADVCGIPSSFIAEYGEGRPIIGLMAEYDALPGLSQTVETKQEARVPGKPGHGCGHNLLGTASLAAAVAVKAKMEQGTLKGTVRLYGTPAEEIMTGKVYMAKCGLFDDLDTVVGWHPKGINAVIEYSTAAICAVKFHYTGIAAHAGNCPQNGRSALDAVELLDISANYLREHVPPDIKLHYAPIVDNLVPNIVPHKASVWYCIRGNTMEHVKEVYQRLLRCAHGASEMTDTTYTVEYLGGSYDYMPNRTLDKELWKVMNQIPCPRFTEEEVAFAEKIGTGSAHISDSFRASVAADYGLNVTGELCEFVAPLSEKKANQHVSGSLDIGDVSYLVPTTQFLAACQSYSCVGHTWQVTAFAGSSVGMKGMIWAAKVLGSMVVHLMQHPELIEAAKKEHEEKIKHHPYTCQLPEGWKPSVS